MNWSKITADFGMRLFVLASLTAQTTVCDSFPGIICTLQSPVIQIQDSNNTLNQAISPRLEDAFTPEKSSLIPVRIRQIETGAIRPRKRPNLGLSTTQNKTEESAITVVIASRSSPKLSVYRDYLSHLRGVRVIALSELESRYGYAGDSEEISIDYEGNALLKARSVQQWLSRNHIPFDFIIADDSGLEVPDLEGRPGVYTRRYALGEQAKARTSRQSPEKAAMQKILSELAAVKISERRIFARGVAVVVNSGGQAMTFQGEVHGVVPYKLHRVPNAEAPFHSILVDPALGKTYPEMSPAERLDHPSLQVRLASQIRDYLFAEENKRLQTQDPYASWKSVLREVGITLADSRVAMILGYPDPMGIGIPSVSPYGWISVVSDPTGAAETIGLLLPNAATRAVQWLEPRCLERFPDLTHTILEPMTKVLSANGWTLISPTGIQLHDVSRVSHAATDHRVFTPYPIDIGEGIRIEPVGLAEPLLRTDWVYDISQSGTFLGQVVFRVSDQGEWSLQEINWNARGDRTEKIESLLRNWLYENQASWDSQDFVPGPSGLTQDPTEEILSSVSDAEMAQHLRLAIQERIDQLKSNLHWYPAYGHVFLADAILDFVGYGIPTELLPSIRHDRQLMAARYLAAIARHPRVWDDFIRHIRNYTVQITAQNRNASLFLVAANYLTDRWLHDRQILDRLPDLSNLESIHQHPWFKPNSRPSGTTVFSPRIQSAPSKVRVLLIGAAEKPGPNRKTDLLMAILRAALPSGTQLDIVATDVTYQSEYYHYDFAHDRFVKRTAFDFTASNHWKDPNSGVWFWKVNPDEPSENVFADPSVYDASEQFDVVINSRLAVQAFRDPTLLNHLLKNSIRHVATDGLLIYDTPDADRADLYYHGRNGDIVEIGSMPFRDLSSQEEDLHVIFDTLGFRSKIIEQAYSYALKHVGSFRNRLLYKRILVNIVAEVSHDTHFLAALFLLGIPESEISWQLFPPLVSHRLLSLLHFLDSSGINPQHIVQMANQTDASKLLSYSKKGIERQSDENAEPGFEKSMPVFTLGFPSMTADLGHIGDRLVLRVQMAGVKTKYLLIRDPVKRDVHQQLRIALGAA